MYQIKYQLPNSNEIKEQVTKMDRNQQKLYDIVITQKLNSGCAIYENSRDAINRVSTFFYEVFT